MALLAAVVVGLAGLALGEKAFAVAGGSAPADAAYGYVVKVNVGGNRGCTGVLLDPQLVATSKECFQVGSAAPVTGPPAVAGTVVTRPDQGSDAKTAAVDYLFVRDDRNLVLTHVATRLTGLRGNAPVSATAPAAGQTLRVLGFGRTADEWVPDLPHTGQFSVQNVSATEIGLAPAGDGAICRGDAGGPLIRENGDGTANLVAVVSTSWQGGCLDATGTRRDATATRLDGLADWINQYKEVQLSGPVEAGTQNGCLVMRVGNATYNLVGGDSAVVKVGQTVHVTGYQAPSSTSTCTDGIRFQVTHADTVQTLIGTVRVGVEHCLVLTSGAETYQLVGGDPAVVQAGAKVTLTGFLVPPGFSACQQGQMFQVLSAVPATPISLRAHANSKYVTADNAGASPLIANRTTIGPWETFDEIALGNGNIALQAHVNDEYVTADNAGTSPLIANRTTIGPWETFLLIHNTDGSISLKAQANGDYVTADNAGTSPLIANRTAIGPWEEFDSITN
jgi:hypothetical protein